jgi:hypothetical protein
LYFLGLFLNISANIRKQFVEYHNNIINNQSFQSSKFINKKDTFDNELKLTIELSKSLYNNEIQQKIIQLQSLFNNIESLSCDKKVKKIIELKDLQLIL